MSSELIVVPEDNLQEVIKVLRAGVKAVKVSKNTKQNLLQWCADMEEYLLENPSRG